MAMKKCILTVDVEALHMRAPENHVNRLIYGRFKGQEYGIGRMMNIADKYGIKMTFFVDFAECELYGDDILEVGRFIEKRGHDMQVHCHYNYLENIVGKKSWVSVTENYYNWYDNYDNSVNMIDYVTKKYMECTGHMPIAYRGGEYRFGIGVLRALKEAGYKADLSYNFVRPRMLAPNTQFMYENNLIEIPMGMLPRRKPLNFNYASLVPQSKVEFEEKLQMYEDIFEEYYDYYGEDAIASVLMHSWSFLFDPKTFSNTGYIENPNEILVEFFELFLERFKDKIDFISVTDAIEGLNTDEIKKSDFKSILRDAPFISAKKLVRVNEFIKAKAKDRRVIIWGKGWMESTVFQTFNFHESLNTAFYISNDATKTPEWRGKPVYKYPGVELNPDTDFVFVIAQPTFSEIRDDLRKMGFKDFEDFYDLSVNLPGEVTNGVQTETKHVCSICGGTVFETYNSTDIRKCSTCNSVERSRTIPKLFAENLKPDFDRIKVLHVSPTIPERKLFDKLGVNRVSIDIRPECKTDIVGDICNMPEVETESFDMVFANCVLNHVYDDELALNEIKRVLKKGGQAVIWVMDSGSLKTIKQHDPTSWYGKENFEKYRVGTYRHYGETDFIRQLRNHFSKVRCYEKYDEVTDSPCKWYICEK